MRKQIIKLIAHIMDGILIGIAITCLVIQEYKAVLIYGTIGILSTVADVITMIEEYNNERRA